MGYKLNNLVLLQNCFYMDSKGGKGIEQRRGEWTHYRVCPRVHLVLWWHFAHWNCFVSQKLYWFSLCSVENPPAHFTICQQGHLDAFLSRSPLLKVTMTWGLVSWSILWGLREASGWDKVESVPLVVPKPQLQMCPHRQNSDALCPPPQNLQPCKYWDSKQAWGRTASPPWTTLLY